MNLNLTRVNAQRFRLAATCLFLLAGGALRAVGHGGLLDTAGTILIAGGLLILVLSSVSILSRHAKPSDEKLPILRIIDFGNLVNRVIVGTFAISLASLFVFAISGYKGNAFNEIMIAILVFIGSSMLAICSVICLNFGRWYIAYTKAGGFKRGQGD